MPSRTELDELEGSYLLITPNLPTWYPHTDKYKNQEFGMTDYKGCIKTRNIKPEDRTIAAVINRSTLDVASDTGDLVSCLEQKEGLTVGTIRSDNRKGRVNAADLARRLNIPVEMARRTLKATTQLTVRTVDEASLTRKFRTNDRMLRYKRLSCDVFTDTFFSSKTTGASVRG